MVILVLKSTDVGNLLTKKLCLAASITLLFLLVLSLDYPDSFQTFKQALGTPVNSSSLGISSNPVSSNGTSVTVELLPDASPLFFKCNETSDNGESTLPGLNVTASAIQALTDGDPNTEILGKVIFDLKFEKPFIDMPGTDLIIYEAGQNTESGSIMYTNGTASSDLNFVGFPSEVTDECGNPINAYKVDLANLGIPAGSTISGLRIDNDPDNDGGADFSDIATVNFSKFGTTNFTQPEYIDLPSESELSSQSTENLNASISVPTTEPVGPALLSNHVNDSDKIVKEPTFLIYNNTDYGVSILYPSNWTKSEENLQSHQLVGFYTPEVTMLKNTFSPAHFSITVEPVSDPNISLSDYSNQFLGMVFPNASDSKILNQSDSTLSGHEAQRIVMLDFLNGQTSKELRVFSIIDGNVYRLGYFAQPGAFMTYLPLVETMIRSFNVTSQYTPIGTNMSEPITPPVIPENITSDNDLYETTPFSSPVIPENITSDNDLYETTPFSSPVIPENITSDNDLYETTPFSSPVIPENITSDNADLYETTPLPSEPGLQQECQQLGIMNASASNFEKDPNDYHPPNDAVDGDSATWWSNKAKESWMQVDLGQVSSICDVSVQWNKGDIREYSFEISVSQDGNAFKNVFDGTNQKGSLDTETYDVEPVDGRYVKLTITGTSSDKGWASIRELSVNGKS